EEEGGGLGRERGGGGLSMEHCDEAEREHLSTALSNGPGCFLPRRAGCPTTSGRPSGPGCICRSEHPACLPTTARVTCRPGFPERTRSGSDLRLRHGLQFWQCRNPGL